MNAGCCNCEVAPAVALCAFVLPAKRYGNDLELVDIVN